VVNVFMKTWFTSDTHFFHRNVVLYCERPYVRFNGELVRPCDTDETDTDKLKNMVDVEAMNADLIKNWNSVVAPEDTVIHLGDFAMGQKSEYANIVSQLQGHKVLISGNHDRSVSSMRLVGFDEVYKYGRPIEYELDGHKLLLNHYPIYKDLWPAGTEYMLCGHVHDEWVRQGGTINVGVDVRDLKPVSLDQLLL
jgi:calcineurin-like phosphoesterase family protein